MKKFKVCIFLLVLVAIILNASPVYADTPDPDSTPAIESINVYRNLRESGDLLLLIYANIPYATTPDLPVTQTFIWNLLDTDNITEFGSTVGSSFNDDGYGYNVYSLYFDSGNVTSLGIVWGTSYPLRLAGNPAAFDTAPIYNYTITAADYSTKTATADAQDELALRIIAIATDLNIKWGLTTTNSLLVEGETGTVLSVATGEAFFRGAIYGLQAMAPTLFSSFLRTINITAREWNEEYSANLTAQWDGTWIDTAQAAGKVLFGTTYDLFSMILLIGMAGALMVGNIMVTKDHWNGMVDVALIGVVGARLGMYDLGFLILVAAGCWIYISIKIWFGLIK